MAVFFMRDMINPKLTVLLLILTFSISSCGIRKIDKTKTWTADKLFTEARNNLKSGNYETALEFYEKLRARYPHHVAARQSEIDSMYAQFKSEEPAAALASAERFIRENPSHPNLDYVYYLRGIIYAESEQDMISRLIKQDPGRRDPKSLRESFERFAELVSKYPTSKYSTDARQRMVYTRNKMAEHELNIADFYFRRQSYVAAINRAQSVIQNFNSTPSAPKALFMLRDAYTALGQTQIAADYSRLIQYNRLNAKPVKIKKSKKKKEQKSTPATMRQQVPLPPPARTSPIQLSGAGT
jgi:outer membrane protein assembly factor BamD